MYNRGQRVSVSPWQFWIQPAWRTISDGRLCEWDCSLGGPGVVVSISEWIYGLAFAETPREFCQKLWVGVSACTDVKGVAGGPSTRHFLRNRYLRPGWSKKWQFSFGVSQAIIDHGILRTSTWWSFSVYFTRDALSLPYDPAVSQSVSSRV